MADGRGQKYRDKLTEQQEDFCREYVIDYNLTQAAIRAKYSEKFAGQTGHELMQLPKIRNRVAQLLKERRQEYSMTVERLQDEICRIAFANPFELIKDLSATGVIKIKSLQDIPNRLKPAVKSIKKVKGGGVEITFHDKIGALEMLAKHFGFFEKDNKQKEVVNAVAVYLPDNGRNKNPTEDEGVKEE